MRHDLTTLELVFAVTRTRSVTLGAEHMHLAVAAASKRISDLEARLGVKLFLRQARGVEPTRACLSLMRHVTTLNDALVAFDQEVAEITRGVSGAVTVALAPEAIAHGLPGRLAAFAAEHPEIRLTISSLQGGEVENAVMTGVADIGVFMRSRRGTRLTSWPYASGRWGVMVPLCHRLAGRETLSFEDIIDRDLIGVERSHTIEHLLSRAALSRGLHFEPRVRSSCMNSLVAMVEAGLGMALTLDVAAQRASMAHGVKHIPLDSRCDRYELDVGVACQERAPAATRMLLDALRAPQCHGT